MPTSLFLYKKAENVTIVSKFDIDKRRNLRQNNGNDNVESVKSNVGADALGGKNEETKDLYDRKCPS